MKSKGVFRDFYGDEANPFPDCGQQPLELVYFRGKFFGKLCVTRQMQTGGLLSCSESRRTDIESFFKKSDVDVGSSFNPVTCRVE